MTFFFFADMLEALKALEDDVPRRLPLALAAVPLRKRRKAWLAVLPPPFSFFLFSLSLSLFFFAWLAVLPPRFLLRLY